eukprot:1483433-Prorocentrum_lima.AAC.1
MKRIRKHVNASSIRGEVHCKYDVIVRKAEEVSEGGVASNAHEEGGHFCKKNIHIRRGRPL